MNQIKRFIAHQIYKHVHKYNNAKGKLEITPDEVNYENESSSMKRFFYVNKENFNMILVIKHLDNKIYLEVIMKSKTILIKTKSNLVSIKFTNCNFKDIKYIVNYIIFLIYRINTDKCFSKLSKYSNLIEEDGYVKP